ncbi:MAG: YhjD/YihY/BrkB family envelope integrity protein [Gammaproteobacteria bacterium]|nr:YhjD/YihY/BrkB family envelope integrity protein [Gammaproteobacteria bacterium]
MFEQHWETLKTVLWNSVWATNIAAMSPLRANTVRVLRVGHMMLRELLDGQLNVRASSLVYSTLLSLIPVLAVAFALLKGFGVHHELEPLLLQFLEPLGEKGAEIGTRIIDFVENIDVRSLGAIGLALLVYTVVRVLQKVEQALNYIWRVRRQRRFFERLSGYISVVIIGPVLVLTAMGISASVMGTTVVRELVATPMLGALVALGSKLVPYLMVVAAFTFVYYYMPNTRVRIASALFGALIAGFLWAVAGWVFASLVVTSTRYAAIYSSFAIVVLFVMWLHIGWLILLMGGSVAFYHQHPGYLGLLTHEVELSNRVKERVALTACFLIAQHFHHRLPPWGRGALARRIGVPLQTMEDLLASLEEAGLLIPVSGDAGAYVPARELTDIGVEDVLDAVRSAGEGRQFELGRIGATPVVDGIFSELEDAASAALAGRTLRDLAEANPPLGNDGAEPISGLSAIAEVLSEPRPAFDEDAPGGEERQTRREQG